MVVKILLVSSSFRFGNIGTRKKSVTNSPTLVVTPNKTSMQEGISGKIANFSSTQN
jgi:hypothetical protein